MKEEGIAGSSATLTKMAKVLRDVCVTAIREDKRKNKQRFGGQRGFVVIDESLFRHKRKASEIHLNYLFPFHSKTLAHFLQFCLAYNGF